jgi:putative colanic acid biosynthesis UDP-glucose lipid carrier transferase
MKSTETELKFLYLAFDLILLNLVLSFMYSINPVLKELDTHDKSLYILILNMSVLITNSLFSKRNLYLHDNYLNKVVYLTNRILFFTIILFIMANLFLSDNYSSLFFLECTLLFFVSELIYYFLIYSYLRFRRSKGFFVHKVLIIGLNDMSIFVRHLLNNNPMLGYEFVGYISDNKVDDTNVLGSFDDLIPLVNQNQIDYIFVTNSVYNDLNKSKELLTICNKIGVRLRFIPENQFWFKTVMNMESVGSLAVFNPQEIPLDSMQARISKRIFDIVFSSVVIIFILSWLFPVLILIIKLNSKGPAFFIQKRTGINNKTFKCLKFRSMCINDDSDEKQATQGDWRITAIGRFLRKSNLDELPQFLNVFLGQMSVVGPRPHMLKHTEEYSKLIEYYKERLYVKPGITGWAQVNGYRGETDELWKMEKRVEYDMYYLENWTLWWDIKIILMTIFGKNSFKNAL